MTSPRLPHFFRWLWLGQGTSMVGTQVTTVALPLAAVLLLHAGPAETGLLSASAYLPWLFALPAGVWVDRASRRRLLLAAEALRGTVLLTVPLSAGLDLLSVPLLCLVIFFVGAGQVVFETAWGSVLPGLLGRDLLLVANGRLEGTRAAAMIAGPGVAGALVRLVGAPFAVLLDVASYLTSLVTIARYVPDSPASTTAPARSLRAEAGEGLRFLRRHPVLRAVALEAALYNVFAVAIETLLVLYAVHQLHLGPGQYGLLLSTGAVGALIGAGLSGPIARRMGLGPAYLATVVIACTALLAVPARAQPDKLGVILVAIGLTLGGFGASSSSVYAATIRQSVVPERLLGRVLAAYRLLSYGSIPLSGAVAAGLGSLLGVRTAILVSAVGLASAPIPLLLAPIRHLRTVEDASALASPPLVPPADPMAALDASS